MGKPKHKRCGVCNVVTSRYSHTVQQGPFTFKVWVRDAKNGEVSRENGNVIRCEDHAATRKVTL